MATSSQIEPNLNTFGPPGAQGPIGLTTIFTPPSTCLDVVTYDGTSFWQGGLLQTGDQNCYPPRFLDIFFSMYTPGICPYGWASLPGRGAIRQIDGNIGTQAFCCPSGYYRSSTDEGILQNVCASVFGSPMTNVFSTSRKGEGPIPVDAELITVDPSSIESNTVYADIIGIQWAATNSRILQLMSEQTSRPPRATATSTAQPAQGATPIASPTAPPASDSTPSSGGLSTGAEAGIGIGAVVGAIALALLAYFLWRRRRKARNVQAGIEEPPPQYGNAQELEEAKSYQMLRAELPSGGTMPPAELPSNGLPSQKFQELPGEQKSQELPGEQVVSELGSDPATNRNTMWSTTTGTVSSRNPSQKQTPNYL